MSIYSYLVCQESKQIIWIGKTIHEDYKPKFYHIGDIKDPKNWERKELNQVIWKFFTENAGKPIVVLMEHQMNEEYYNFQEIGGEDLSKDISFEDYLKNWEGN